MAAVLFYEKPGCINNTRQKAILLELGHEVSVRNLLTEPWSANRLRVFFGNQPVTAWFNSSAPRIKSGEVKPQGLGESEALALMVEDPLLIRRPLIETNFGRMAGFDPCEMLERLGVILESDQDLQTCSRTPNHSSRVDAGAEDA
jgi:nitrogenase-associated protein